MHIKGVGGIIILTEVRMRCRFIDVHYDPCTKGTIIQLHSPIKDAQSMLCLLWVSDLFFSPWLLESSYKNLEGFFSEQLMFLLNLLPINYQARI